MTTKMAGTFSQETPGAGRTWHVVADDNRTECGHKIENSEYWTTDQMAESKVCGYCLIAVVAKSLR